MPKNLLQNASLVLKNVVIPYAHIIIWRFALFLVRGKLSDEEIQSLIITCLLSFYTLTKIIKHPFYIQVLRNWSSGVPTILLTLCLKQYLQFLFKLGNFLVRGYD